MLTQIASQYTNQIESFFYLLALVNGLLHVLFAGAVAKDSGNLYRLGQRPVLVSGGTWAFATLLGGVFTAAIYWILHYSTLTRTSPREIFYDKK